MFDSIVAQSLGSYAMRVGKHADEQLHMLLVDDWAVSGVDALVPKTINSPAARRNRQAIYNSAKQLQINSLPR